MYEWQMFVEYIIWRYEYDNIDSTIRIKKEVMEELDKRIKPVIYKVDCDDMLKEDLDMIDSYLKYYWDV